MGEKPIYTSAIASIPEAARAPGPKVQEWLEMSATKKPPLVLQRREAIAALLASAAGPMLLAACGGGGSGDPAAGGGAAAGYVSGPISGLGSIIVGGVRFDDSAARVEDDDGSSHSRSELALGMMVEIECSSIDDNLGRGVAALIRFGSEIKGPVASVDVGTQTIRLLDQTVEIKPETVFDPRLVGGFAALAPGQILEIHALYDSTRNLFVATRIELEDGADAYRLRGLVSQLDTTARTFKINDAVISYAGVADADLPANFANGARVRVRLRAQAGQSTGPWQALTVRSGIRRVDDIGDARVRGFVTDFGSSSQFEVNGIKVDATNASFEPNAGAVQLGVLVDVRGRAQSGTIVASRVKVINRGSDDWQRVELHGTVSALDTTAKAFVLREVTVDYSRVIEWRNGQPGDLSDGDALEVKGVWSEDRRKLFAVIVEFE